MFSKRDRLPFYEVTIPEESPDIAALERSVFLDAGSVRNVTDSTIVPYENRKNTKKDYLFADILKDRGNGRVSSGLRSLELLSRLCGGADASKLFLFDTPLYVGAVGITKRAVGEELFQIVYRSLGMTEVVENLSTEQLASAKKLFNEIGAMVKTGNFQKENYRLATLTECKRLTRLYLNSK